MRFEYLSFQAVGLALLIGLNPLLHGKLLRLAPVVLFFSIAADILFSPPLLFTLYGVLAFAVIYLLAVVRGPLSTPLGCLVALAFAALFGLLV